ncbi:MAG: DUF624 domain-containing protein [Anaerolineae bacterium]|jgi:uncharacterized membrane protein YesL
MAEALRVIRRAGRALFEEAATLFLLNILVTLALFIVVPFPPALAGLWSVARRIAEGRIVHLREGWDGFVRYFWPAWGLTLVNLAVVALIAYNFWFYSPAGPFALSSSLHAALQGVWVALLALWGAWQMYVFPIVLEQERPHLLRAMGQALRLLVEHPAYSLVFLVVIALLAVFSVLLQGLGFFFTPAVVALLTVFATRHLLGRENPEP